MSIGDKINQLRRKNHKTLKELAAFLGVSLNTVYRWEHGMAKPRERALKKIAAYFDMPLDWLLDSGTEPDEAEKAFLEKLRRLPEPGKYQVLGYMDYVYYQGRTIA